MFIFHTSNDVAFRLFCSACKTEITLKWILQKCNDGSGLDSTSSGRITVITAMNFRFIYKKVGNFTAWMTITASRIIVNGGVTTRLTFSQPAKSGRGPIALNTPFSFPHNTVVSVNSCPLGITYWSTYNRAWLTSPYIMEQSDHCYQTVMVH